MVRLPVKNRRFWSPQKRLEISRGESNCGRSPGSLPLECRTFSGTGVFTVWYRDFYLKWKQTTFTLWRFQVLFIVSAAKTTGSISIFPQSIENSHDNKTVLPFYICSYSPPVLWPHTAATSFPPAHDSALAGGGIPRRSHTRCDIWTLQHVSWSSLYFVFSQLVQIIATGRRHEQMSPPAQLFPVNKRKYWFLHYLFIS